MKQCNEEDNPTAVKAPQCVVMKHDPHNKKILSQSNDIVIYNYNTGSIRTNNSKCVNGCTVCIDIYCTDQSMPPVCVSDVFFTLFLKKKKEKKRMLLVQRSS